jgi:antitoxin Phd
VMLMTRHMTSQLVRIVSGGIVDTWQVQDAKARFSELLDTTLKRGPQVVTRRGVAAAVLVPIDEWKRLQQAARPGLKELLMAPGSRIKDLIPERRSFRRRGPVDLE